MKISFVFILALFIQAMNLTAQNNILDITVTKGEFEFRCNKHLNILPNTQDIICSIGFQKQGEKDNKKIFENYIGLANYSFTGKDKGKYTVVFHNGNCKAFYVFDYKGVIPKIQEIPDCKK
jgi:hypothetical protein